MNVATIGYPDNDLLIHLVKKLKRNKVKEKGADRFINLWMETEGYFPGIQMRGRRTKKEKL